MASDADRERLYEIDHKQSGCLTSDDIFDMRRILDAENARLRKLVEDAIWIEDHAVKALCTCLGCMNRRLWVIKARQALAPPPEETDNG